MRLTSTKAVLFGGLVATLVFDGVHAQVKPELFAKDDIKLDNAKFWKRFVEKYAIH
jgi:hypothetical protein